jgi:hypothetical protein
MGRNTKRNQVANISRRSLFIRQFEIWRSDTNVHHKQLISNQEVNYKLKKIAGKTFVFGSKVNDIKYVRVFTIDGQIVKDINEFGNTEQQLNLEDLCSGVYFVEVGLAGSSYLEKIIL